MANGTPKMIVHEIDPRPRLVRHGDLPPSGVLGRGPRELAIRPTEVALLHRGGRVTLHAPAGAADQRLALRSRAETALVVPREWRALASLEHCHFADGFAGTVSLWAHGAVVGTDRSADHPLTQDVLAASSESGFLRRLRDSMWQSFGPQLLELVAGVPSAAPARTTDLAKALKGFVRREDVRAALRRDGVFMFTDDLKVHAVESPERDAHEAGAAGPLGLVAAWRALDAHGTLNPRLGPRETLPSGTWLDVAVTVTRDAHIYVLVRGSTGRWQCLVPDRAGLLGIPRPNRQRAGETVRWPGRSRRFPDKPCWRLDSRPGTERVAVVASLDALGERVERLFDSAGPAYRRAAEGLVGDGCVMQELVIEHVAGLAESARREKTARSAACM